MAEFKFSCPQCDQHILCDTDHSGLQINCPSCQQLIVIPPAPHSAAAPPAPSVLATRYSTATPASGRQFAGASGAQPPKKSNSALKAVLIVAVVLIGVAGGFFGVTFALKHVGGKSKGNPAAQVTAPTAAATVQALSLLTKVHSAYTNLTSVSADGTITLFLDLSNLTVADVNPNIPANAKNANRHPPGMPRIITNLTEISIKQAQSNMYYFAGEAVSKIDRQAISNTFAFWSSDKGKFMFTDSHLKGIPASYQQLPDVNPANDPSAQFKNLQHIFDDPAQLTKIIKDFGQTDDETVNGQDCYTVTAKVLGQKVKIWVDKGSYLISQWQITLGGAISDADIDDAFSLFAAGVTNVPSAQLDVIKAQVKKMTPTMTKIRGTITSTSRNLEMNPTLSADDFSYPVPEGVRLVRMPVAATTTASSIEARQRNACINNLRQIDAAKNEWALEKGKTNGSPVTEADLKPYIKLDAQGNLPKCPAGGKYTIGRVGESPTCSVPGHVLP
jgi:hypothetical protein